MEELLILPETSLTAVWNLKEMGITSLLTGVNYIRSVFPCSAVKDD